MDDQLVIGVVITFVIFALVLTLVAIFRPPHIESPEKRAGRIGEKFASTLIREILSPEDILLTNVHLRADGQETEIDNVVVNSHGVFIIEVKNYSGQLFGKENDNEWIKNKILTGGSVYQTKVKNPIKQVKRQIYILSQVFQDSGIDVRTSGYVFFVEQNSPVRSQFVLDTRDDMNRAIHGGKEKLSDKTRECIVSIL